MEQVWPLTMFKSVFLRLMFKLCVELLYIVYFVVFYATEQVVK